MKILENGVVRDATSEEIAQREAQIVAEQARQAEVVLPTKESLMAQLATLSAQIQAMADTA